MAANAILGLLPASARKRLAAAGSLLVLAPGEFLCRKGDPGDAVFVVMRGEIEVKTTHAKGGDVRFAGMHAGSVVGEMSVVDGGVRSTDMAAVGAARLWRIPREALMEALSSEPPAAMALIVELARRLRSANDALEAMRRLDLGGRLARLLLETASDASLIPLTQLEIARRLSVSREAVNRKLNSWVGRGWVSLSRSGVRVLDEASLATLGSGGAL